jgi:VWFA-related protein
MKMYFGIFFCLQLILIAFSQIFFAQTTERQKPKIKEFGSTLFRKPDDNLVPKKVKKKDSAIDEDIIRIDINLVVVDCLVIDEKGNSILDLKQDDFIITENDQPQEIQFLKPGDEARIPRSIVLIFDYSPSQLPYLESGVEAAKLLVDNLRPNDLMAIVTDDVEIVAQFTSDKIKLKKELDSLKKKGLSRQFGKSAQFSSLYAVLNEMFDQEDVRPIILFQTDGDQLFNLRGGIGHKLAEIYNQKGFSLMVPQAGTIFSLNDLTKKVERSRATIYSIVGGINRMGLSYAEKREKIKLEQENNKKIYQKIMGWGLPDTRSNLERWAKIRQETINKYYPNGLDDEQETMSALSKLSGGWIDFLEKPEDAERVYSRILTETGTRYILGFSPSNETKDGRRRTVKIEVKGHPEYVVWGRKSYMAPLPE